MVSASTTYLYFLIVQFHGKRRRASIKNEIVVVYEMLSKVFEKLIEINN